MNEKQRKELLNYLVELQIDCSEVKVGIGYTNNNNSVEKDIVIYTCPPIIIDKLIEKGYNLNLDNGKIYVDRF